MNIKINLYRAEQKDDDIKLYISLSDGENREEKEFFLSAKQYFELGCPSGEISTDVYGKIEEADEVRRAVKKGMGILLYGDNTAKKLTQKLSFYGFSRESAEKAVEYLRGLGFIDEEKIARRIFEASLKKGYGKIRITAEMLRKGVQKETVSALLSENDLDYTELCRSVIARKWGALPTDKAARAKAVRSLLSLGYGFDEINAAAKEE